MLPWGLLPPGGESKAVQVWLGRGIRREGGRDEEVEKGGAGPGLLVTAQKLHSQGDALVPLPRQDAHVAAVERRLKYVRFVNVVVAVAREDLHREEEPMKNDRQVRPSVLLSSLKTKKSLI